MAHTRQPRQRGERGKSPATLLLIARARQILAAQHPHSVRGVCYQLFIKKWLRSMAKIDTDKVSKHLVYARETGDIPFRIQVWSEKATVSGILSPVLHEYGVDWCYIHGYNSATKVHEKAEESLRDARQLIVLYVGDHDCSGMNMSEYDLPRRLVRYGGRVTLRRIALTAADCATMPTLKFPANRTDSRYRWYVERYGVDCWELDAMNASTLRARVREAIRSHIDWPTWERCQLTEAATKETIRNLVPIISRQATK
jgi:hypothetical protein